ncbi:MAG TPA: LuxR C-terminal-related transcriptional regulator, partial [Thermomicrobiales bacterium]|nr:LuxR C-terminal-related transcriptional regulator [Thermomicrobiales bacterium]
GLLAAAEAAEAVAGGVAFVPLAAVRDPAQVAAAVASALGVKEAAGQPLAAALAAYLRERRMLLLLDNFEQVLPAAAFLAELLAACPALTLLVTSRAALRLAAEREYVVPPLDLPAPDGAPAPEDLWRNEAVRLFVERARGVAPAFAASGDDARAIAAICRRLDGLPLAIELAAARCRLLSPPALLARLERRLGLLTGGGADLPARQQTLRATLDWSYLLLGPADQALFARLAVFAGDFTLEAAEAICAEASNEQGEMSKAAPGEDFSLLASRFSPLDVLTGLESLASKHLVRQAPGADGEPRLSMLETIREYALERLVASGAEGELRRRHADYYLALAESEPVVRGLAWGAWLARLDQEYDDVRAALRWVLDAGEAETALRFGVALRRFWHARGEIGQGRRWLEEALAGGGAPAPELRARAVHALANLAHYQGDYPRARALYEQDLRLWRAIGDRQEIAAALARLAELSQHQGDYGTARVLHDEGLALWREVGDPSGIAASLAELGMLAYRQGGFRRAAAALAEALALARDAGDAWLAARCLAELSWVALYGGDPARADDLAGQSLALGEDLGDRRTIVEALRALGWVALAVGDRARARTRLGEGLALYREAGIQWGIAFCLEGLAAVAAQSGQLDRAARLGGAAEALREAIGAPSPPAHHAHYARYLGAVRGRATAAAWAAAWAAGRTLPGPEAIALALTQEPDEHEGEAPPPAPARDYPAGLSPREVEVLRLLATGLRDIEIAERLYLSPRTVSTHLRSIYNKLGVASRAAATRFAVERGLT